MIGDDDNFLFKPMYNWFSTNENYKLIEHLINHHFIFHTLVTQNRQKLNYFLNEQNYFYNILNKLYFCTKK
jgi:hypothetical protein